MWRSLFEEHLYALDYLNRSRDLLNFKGNICSLPMLEKKNIFFKTAFQFDKIA